MASCISKSGTLCVALCNALGLKRVVKLVLTMEVGSLTVVEATMFPDEAAVAPVLKRFHLKAVPVLESPGAETETRPAS